MAISAAHLSQFADFVILEAELTDADKDLQAVDVDIFLDIVYDEARGFSQDTYDAMIADRDPLDLPWAALRGGEGEPAPAMVLILNRREDLEPDDDPEFELWQKVADTLTEEAALFLDKQLREGWRPDVGVPQDPYTDGPPPTTKPPTTKPPTTKPPTAKPPTKPAVVVEEVAVEVIKEVPVRDRDREKTLVTRAVIGSAVVTLAMMWMLRK